MGIPCTRDGGDIASVSFDKIRNDTMCSILSSAIFNEQFK